MQTHSHGERLRRISGVEACVETLGDRAHPADLLVDGAAAVARHTDPVRP